MLMECNLLYEKEKSVRKKFEGSRLEAIAFLQDFPSSFAKLSGSFSIAIHNPSNVAGSWPSRHLIWPGAAW